MDQDDEPKWIRREKDSLQAPFSPEHRSIFPDDSQDKPTDDKENLSSFKPINFLDTPQRFPRISETPFETSKLNEFESIQRPDDDQGGQLTGEIIPDEIESTTSTSVNREEKVLNFNPQRLPRPQHLISYPFPKESPGNTLNFAHRPNNFVRVIYPPDKNHNTLLTGESPVTFVASNRKEDDTPSIGTDTTVNKNPNNAGSGRHFKPQTLLRISETLGALNTVGRFLVNMTSGIETPSDEVPTAIYTISKNVLGPNVTDTIAPFVLPNVGGLKITNNAPSTPPPEKDLRICTTPENLPGYCDDLSVCPQLLLNLRILRESICFKSLFVPGVCCPRSIDKIESIIQTTTTTTTSTTTNNPIISQNSTIVNSENVAQTTASTLISSSTVLKPSSVLIGNSTKPLLSLNGNVIDPKDCGQSQSAKFRVVGGEEALPGRWPWMAAIFLHGNKRTEFWCGGSLITAKHVLSAAHCTRDSQQRPFPARQFTIRLGDIDLKRTDEPSAPVTFKVKEVKTHPQFSRIGFYNDIAIFVLDRQARRSRYVIPLCLPPPQLRKESFAGQRTTVVGWGTTYYGGKESTVQRQAILPIWRNEDCDQAYFQPITSNFICAGYSRGGTDACQGDSGGPLMLQRNARWIQVGVVSFGNKCGEPGYPGVYTRVTEYLDWINENIKD
ncbi:proclotting enzyme [Agrilus planipennis]|uniref:Proclotting enzyme n=1 Tax=Agrilus planipennis TaxID=224129 RepID=A0A1W4WKJ3_AGRPL|nr:proclotting enzyme [Agrilus planipennis]